MQTSDRYIVFNFETNDSSPNSNKDVVCLFDMIHAMVRSSGKVNTMHFREFAGKKSSFEEQRL